MGSIGLIFEDRSPSNVKVCLHSEVGLRVLLSFENQVKPYHHQKNDEFDRRKFPGTEIPSLSLDIWENQSIFRCFGREVTLNLRIVSTRTQDMHHPTTFKSNLRGH